MVGGGSFILGGSFTCAAPSNLALEGTLPTGATWLRELALNHPKYKGDATLSQEMAYDILKVCPSSHPLRSEGR